MVGFSGDTDKLRRVQTLLDRMGRSAPQIAAQRAAEEIPPLINGEYRRGESPDGNAWAPLKNDSGDKPLRGILDGMTIEARGKRVEVLIPKPYAIYHQEGTPRMVARPILPDPGDLPERWHKRVMSAVAGSLLKAEGSPHLESSSVGA